MPSPGDSDRGQVLDEDRLNNAGPKLPQVDALSNRGGRSLHRARRNEILALRWSDLDPTKKTLRIERALEETKAGGRTIKPPKTARGVRTIEIDNGLLALLLNVREKHQRVAAGIPDGVVVDLSLVRLPEGALDVPQHGGSHAGATRLRENTRSPVSSAAKLGPRASPACGSTTCAEAIETILLDKGVPVHVVAARCGHDPAVLLRTYAKRTRKADTSAAAVIGEI